MRRVEAEWAREDAFVRIPPGGVPAPYCFTMGSSAVKGAPQYDPQRYKDEGPVHKVCLKPFDLDKYDVTQWEWRQVMVSVPGTDFPFNSNPSDTRFKGDRQPVEQVSWNDAQSFLWLMSLFGQHDYRLPSEAEWEYAARAGTPTPYFWGVHAEDGCAYAKMSDSHYQSIVPNALPVDCHYKDVFGTEPVGSLKPNPWGLYDVLGNVFQWVEDCYVNSYSDAPRDGGTYTKGPCTNRVLRGGSWNYFPRIVRAANRSINSPDVRNDDVGFRVARTIAP